MFASLFAQHLCTTVMLLAGKKKKSPKWLSMAVVETAQIDTGGIDRHGRQRSRVRDTRSRDILEEELGDRSCGLINTHCMWRDSKIE